MKARAEHVGIINGNQFNELPGYKWKKYLNLLFLAALFVFNWIATKMCATCKQLPHWNI